MSYSPKTASPRDIRGLYYWVYNELKRISALIGQISFADGPSLGAFGRLRVADPHTIFDSKQIHDNQPLFWDDQEVSGSGTASAHSVDTASSVMSVGATTAGKRVRQTFQRFNYQPAKSQLIFCTFSRLDTVSGITKEVGYFDDNNGLFLRSSGGTLSFVRRTHVTGAPVDNVVAQASWNLDKLDGTGTSGFTLDPTKTQILITDFEWLGVGRVRMGFVEDGQVIYCHEFLNANNLDKVYMSTPNLPIRYSIENDGTGVAEDFEHICSSVISEGGYESTGILTHESSGSVSSLANTNTYALLGIRLKGTTLDASQVIETVSLLTTTGNDDVEWFLLFNPTVAGTFTYNAITNSTVEIAKGSSANTVTGGTIMHGGFTNSSQPASNIVPNALLLGSSIAGVPDEIILAVRPITANITVEAAMTWRELS